MSYFIKIESGELIEITELTIQLCEEKSNEILKIINIIPYINWCKDDLFNDSDFFGNKWSYSLVAINQHKEIVGVIIAYFRMADTTHILDSLYIHRFAVKPEYQKLGLGTELLRFFLHKSFKEILWLCNITIQTNKNEQNSYVINFYKKMGFNELYLIYYSNKTDILMLYERSHYNELPKHNWNVDYIIKPLGHPRLNSLIGFNTINTFLPSIYFSSTNTYKKELVKFIFNNYNIEVEFVNPLIPLVEPQVEKPIFE